MTKKEIINLINEVEKTQYELLYSYTKDFGIDSDLTNIQRIRWAALWSLKKAIEENNPAHVEYLKDKEGGL